MACTHGGLAVWSAVLLPTVALTAIGASELGVVSADKTRLQDATDAAALAAANELVLDPSAAVAERAKAYAIANAGDVVLRSQLTAEATILEEGKGINVKLISRRTSFFGNMLPPGGFVTQAQSTAQAMGRTSLCVIGLDTASGDHVHLRDYGVLYAPKCNVHSNRDVLVGRYAAVGAKATQAVGTASGSIAPAPLTGAEPVADPFAKRAIVIPPCPAWQGIVTFPNGTTTELAPGVHCGQFVVEKWARLKLLPGAHYFVAHPAQTGDKLSVKDWAHLIGDDVVLYFGDGSKLEVAGAATLDLKGRKSGPDAGMLLISARESTKTFQLASYAVKRLEGVIYMPNAMLQVSGPRDLIAEQSNWTISITKKLQILGAPILVINAEYGRSDVPVPAEAKVALETRLTH